MLQRKLSIKRYWKTVEQTIKDSFLEIFSSKVSSYPPEPERHNWENKQIQILIANFNCKSAKDFLWKIEVNCYSPKM